MIALFMGSVVSEIQQRTYCNAKDILKIFGRDMEGTDLKEAYGIIIISVTQRSSNRFYYLEPRFKTKQNELLRPDSTK